MFTSINYQLKYRTKEMGLLNVHQLS